MEDIDDLEAELEVTIKNKSLAKKELPSVRTETLSGKEQRFVYEYCETLNAMEAHRRAYGGKMLDDIRKMEVDKLFARPEIERKIRPLLAKKLDATVAVAPHWVMRYIDEILNLDPLDFYEADGLTIKPLDQIPMEKRKFLRVGKPTVNNKTGSVYAVYEITPMLAALDRLFDIVKLVSTVNANKAPDAADMGEVEERRRKILESVDI
jgi:hypothetical protein